MSGTGAGLLASILATKRRELDVLRHQRPEATTRDPLDVRRVLRRHPRDETPLRVLAEIKLRSPSAGPLSRVLSPPARAMAYAEAGAAMISVCCDETFFDGSWAQLESVRRRLDEAGRHIPVLAKEFVLDERQIEEARSRGADAILLIARLVPPVRLSELARAARAAGIEPLVEVVDEAELEAALSAGAHVVGVNARDLDTLVIDAARAGRVLAAVPEGRIAVHLSGLRQPADIRPIARSRADAALVGEALMRDDDPGTRLQALVAAAAPPFETSPIL